MMIDWSMVVFLGAAGLIGYTLWSIARPAWPIEITVTPQGVRSAKGLPEARRQRILEFLERDIEVSSKVTIRATRGTGGRLRTKFTGPIDRGTQQRIRNYLITEL